MRLSLLLLVGCTQAPELTFNLHSTEQPLHSSAWEPVGIAQTADGIDIYVSFTDELVIDGQPRDGAADKNQNTIVIKRGLTPFRFAVILAHEIGHVLLNTAEHGDCGVMGAADVILCPNDMRMACDYLGLCK